MNFDETIFIEVDEEIPSLVEKMKAAEGKTIALVVPKNAMVLQSVVNLKLLSREAERYGKKISLVTTDRLGRHLASQVGIPVFEDLKAESPVSEIARTTPPSEEILEVDLTSKKKAPPVPVHHYLGGESKHIPVSSAGTHIRFPKPPKWLVIALGIVAVLLLVLFYPRTSVVLGVKTEPYVGDVDAVLDKSAKELVTNSNILPATSFSNEQEKTQTFPATGKKNVGVKATGEVTVYNATGAAKTIDADTKFTAVDSGKVFVSKGSVTVPAGTLDANGNIVPGTAKVTIEATEAGSDYNVDPERYRIQGQPQDKVYARGKTSGGTTEEVTVVSADDLSKAFESLKNELFLSTLSKVKEEVADDRKAMFDNAVNQQVISQSSDKKEGDEATEFSATLKAKTETLGFVEAAYREMVINLAGLRLPEGKELIVGAADEIETQVSESDWEKGVVKLKVQIRTHVADAIDTEAVRRAVRGKSLGTAYSYTQGLPGVVDVVIDTRPRLLGRVAFLLSGVTVKTEPR
jgi:hypothetical protein